MALREPIEFRPAIVTDVTVLREFGERVIPAHYAPLIGADAAANQLTTWWGEEALRTAAEEGKIHLALAGGLLVGVIERDRWDGSHVIWKLYVDADHRGRGIGSRLIDEAVAELPDGADTLMLEHFAANTRAGAFYARAGFAVDHVVPDPSGDERLDVVWRAKRLR